MEFAIVGASSILLGITMKLADLCDEDGLRLFRYDAIIFGILWGGFGAALMLQDVALASAWSAVYVGYLWRGKIDFINHGIAVGIIFAALLASQIDVSVSLFGGFLIAALLSGWLEDRREIRLYKTFSLHDLLFYTILPAGYWIMTGEAYIVASFVLYIVSYEMVKHWFERSHAH